jgi:archaellum biogenesis protein FlaJ (TadC family)
MEAMFFFLAVVFISVYYLVIKYLKKDNVWVNIESRHYEDLLFTLANILIVSLLFILLMAYTYLVFTNKI